MLAVDGGFITGVSESIIDAPAVPQKKIEAIQPIELMQHNSDVKKDLFILIPPSFFLFYLFPISFSSPQRHNSQ